MVRLGDICEKKIDTIKAAYKEILIMLMLSSLMTINVKVITQIQVCQSKTHQTEQNSWYFQGDILVSTVRPNLKQVSTITEVLITS